MNRKSTPAIAEPIAELQRQLDQFRSTQPRRTKLPESLWHQGRAPAGARRREGARERPPRQPACAHRVAPESPPERSAILLVCTAGSPLAYPTPFRTGGPSCTPLIPASCASETCRHAPIERLLKATATPHTPRPAICCSARPTTWLRSDSIYANSPRRGMP